VKLKVANNWFCRLTSCNVQLSYHRRQLQTGLQNSWAKTAYDGSYPTSILPLHFCIGYMRSTAIQGTALDYRLTHSRKQLAVVFPTASQTTLPHSHLCDVRHVSMTQLWCHHVIKQVYCRMFILVSTGTKA